MALPWSCYCVVLVLLHGAILCSHIPQATAGPSRYLQWLDEDSEEGYFQRWRRDLEYSEEDGDGDADDTNCSRIEDPPPQGYNDTCEFVKEECESLFELFNYLRLVICSIGKPAGFIFLCLWLGYLLLLLSTTVDKFFVPVLQLMAEKLRLPSSIAGMTLLALGNGAPDIFVAFSALQDDDLGLMLGVLLGAGLFVVAVVLGTVLLLAPKKTYNINPLDFMRNIIAYIIVLVIIVAVAYDGKVTLAEGICFPLLYILYVTFVVTLSYFTKWLAKRRAEKAKNSIYYDKEEEEVTIEDESSQSTPPAISRAKRSLTKESEKSTEKTLATEKSTERTLATEKSTERSDKKEASSSVIVPVIKKPVELVLVGLTIPKGKVAKVIYVLEFPFSVLRWLTIPPCYHDGHWTIIHFLFAVMSPVPMSLFLLLVATGGWSGFTRFIPNTQFPVCILVVLCVSPLCLVLFFGLSHKRPPHWIMQIFLMVLAFVMSIAWLNIIANELVSVLQALGLLAGISTAILGLTVLAIGNSVADWVADSLVSLKGKPEMALASVFGAPLITHVLGLSFALLPKIFQENGDPYIFDIRTLGFVHVKLAWIFLGIVLVGSAIIFPIFRFNPPREYSLVLVYVYAIFMLFSVLVEAGVFNITLL